MKRIEHIHCHSDLSNFSYFENVTKVEDLIKKAVELGCKTFGCTEHGNVLNWVKKKKLAEKSGLKYWHGVEAYVCWDNAEEYKKEKEAQHLILIALNYDGVLELNRMVSTSYEDEYRYYKPRMTFDMIKNTSDNIAITTACLGSPFYQYLKSGNYNRLKEWTMFLIENKHRVYLEVQNHDDEDQKIYNEWLLKLHYKTGIPLIASCDVHTIDEESNKLRLLMKEAKGSSYESDDQYRLYFDSYDDVFKGFKKQGVLSDDEIERAIQGTIDLTDRVEDFKLDKSPKYPKISDSPEEDMKKAVAEGYISRGLHKLPVETQKLYKERVLFELSVFKKTGSLQYMLLEEESKRYGRSIGMTPGAGRGSSGGSLISWLLYITDIDPIRWGLSFSRFLHSDRIAPPDIDSDWSKDNATKMQKYLLTSDKISAASIVTFGTFGVKGAIDALGRGLKNDMGDRIYDYGTIDRIKHQLIMDGTDVIVPEYLRDEYPDLFSKVEKIVGVTQSIGRHAAAIICSSEKLDETIGTMRVPKWEYPVSAINMDEVEKLQYVKLDVLGVRTIQTYQGTAELLGFDPPSVDSDYLDIEDPLIWEEARKDTTTLFQFDDDGRSSKVLQDLLNPTTIQKMKELDPEGFSYIKLASVANAGIRPGAKSIIENLQAGIVKDNGSEIINKMLSESLGYLAFQEQSLVFLREIANYSDAEADKIRRAIGHKIPEVIEEEVPKIRKASIETLTEEYDGDSEKATVVADEFMQIFMDSVNYQFNKSHSIAYSINLGIQLWFRTYHKLEYLTTCLEVWKNSPEKTKKVLDYAEKNGIKISEARFGYSRGDYFFDKETNTIYQGTSPIKGNNGETGDLLYELKDLKFETFTDLLLYIKDGTSYKINGDILELKDIFEMEESKVKSLEKAISSATKYKDFDPFTDKMVSKRFDKFINGLDPNHDISVEFQNSDGDESKIRDIFNVWLEDYDKGKQPWKDEQIDFEILGGSLPINKTKMETLIHLDYFENFGTSKKLSRVYEMFSNSYKPANKTFAKKIQSYNDAKHYELNGSNEEFSIIEKIEFQNELIGRITLKSPDVPQKYAYVAEIVNVGKTRTTAMFYLINKGVYQEVKVGSKLFRNVPFREGDLIEVTEFAAKPKIHRIQGEYVKSETEKDLWITGMKFIRKSKTKKTGED